MKQSTNDNNNNNGNNNIRIGTKLTIMLYIILAIKYFFIENEKKTINICKTFDTYITDIKKNYI